MISHVSTPFFVAQDKSARSLILHEGERISVHVNERLPDGSVRISVRGFSLVAQTHADVKPHTTITMAVRFQGNTLALVPLDSQTIHFQEQTSLAHFDKPEVARTIVQTLSDLHGNIDISRLEVVYNASSEFVKKFLKEKEGKKAPNEKALLKNVAFLETILHDKKTLLSYEQKKSILTRLFPIDDKTKHEDTDNSRKNATHASDRILYKSTEDSSDTEMQHDKNALSHDDELLTLLNHTQGSGLWNYLIVPFEMTDASIRGAALFLLQTTEGSCKKVILRAQCEENHFVFTIEDSLCSFFGENQTYDKQQEEKLVKALQIEFQKRGLKTPVQYVEPQQVGSVNVEV